MKSIAEVLRLGRNLRVIGFDDAPFAKSTPAGSAVHLAGVVCAGTRFEGMLWGEVERDGAGATERVARLLCGSKFHEQVHLVLTDGVAFGGFNVVDLPALAALTSRPCVAVMRKMPDLAAVDAALEVFPDARRRRELIARAGPIHHAPPFFFQVAGGPACQAASALAALTDVGHVPEALRLAHIIGAAVKTGQSSGRA